MKRPEMNLNKSVADSVEFNLSLLCDHLGKCIEKGPLEATVAVESTKLPIYNTERSTVFTGTKSAATSAEIEEYSEKVQSYLNAYESPLLFIDQIPLDGLIQFCYFVCREFLKPQPGSDYRTVLEACSIEVNSNSTIVAWSLLEAIKRKSPEHIALYAWLVETACTSGKSWALLWPLWKHQTLKKMYLRALFLLIAYAKTDNMPEACFSASKTTRLPDWNRGLLRHSLAVKVSQTLSAYIDSTCPRKYRSLSTYNFEDPKKAIWEEISKTILQIKPTARSQKDLRRKKVANALGVVYSGNREQMVLLDRCWEFARKNQLGMDYSEVYLRLITFKDN